jgi:hypothetical protein
MGSVEGSRLAMLSGKVRYELGECWGIGNPLDQMKTAGEAVSLRLALRVADGVRCARMRSYGVLPSISRSRGRTEHPWAPARSRGAPRCGRRLS